MLRRLSPWARRISIPVCALLIVGAGSVPALADDIVVDTGTGTSDFDLGIKDEGRGNGGAPGGNVGGGRVSGSDAGGGSGADPAVYTPPPLCVIGTPPVAGAPEAPVTGADGSVTQRVLVAWKCSNPDGTTTYSPPFYQDVAVPGAPEAPPAPPPPNPAVVAEEAYSKIRFPAPTPHLSPYTELAVKYWNYLWVDDPGALTASASAAGLTVTATATLTSSTWSMGEWRSLDDSRPVPSFTCVGGGRKPPADPEWSVAQEPSTDCAYWFRWRSLDDRTDGAGTWPVTVSTTWDITWTATNGMTGTASRTQTSAPVQVAVGEWRTVTVAGDGPADGEGQR